MKRWNLLGLILGFFDVFAITSAFQLAFSIYYNNWSDLFYEDKTLLYLFAGITPVWLLILYFIKIAEIPRTKKYRMLVFEYLQSTILAGAVLIIIYFAFRTYLIPRQFLALFCSFGFLFLLVLRMLEYKVFRVYRARGYNYKNLVLIADDKAIPFIDTIRTNNEWGYKILSIITESDNIYNNYEDSIVLMPDRYILVLHDLMKTNQVDEIIYFRSGVNSNEARNIIRSCEELGVTFSMHIDELNNKLSNAVRTSFANENFLTFINIPYKPVSLAAKRILDISISLLAIILFAPFMIVLEIIIMASSKGPAIFKQERVGLRGRIFNMYKFRTMVNNAEELKKELEAKNEADGPAFKIQDDPRITGIGKFLRRSGLDELPQLINILRGEMSLIGPRPALKSETEQYKRWQLRRLSVKPGLSCFWQIKPGRSSIKFNEWMEMDLAYIDNWSFRLDLIILFRTIKALFPHSIYKN